MTTPVTASDEAEQVPRAADHSPFMPPRWFVRIAWLAHRAMYRVTGGRRGLWPPAPGKWGTMRLFTVGRKTGRERIAILGYFEDGPNLVTMAMNGWGAAEPAWWLNLQAQPDVMVEVKGVGSVPVRGHAAAGEERDRLWDRWRSFNKDLDGYATRRSETAVVVLEPRPAVGG